MLERCDLSDLLVTECACRLHATPEPAYEAGEITTRFSARFDSECDGCGGQIYEGDRIARTVNGEYICERCHG